MDIKKSNEITLKDALDALKKVWKVDDRMLEIKLREVWEKLMGRMIAEKTTGIYFQNGLLKIGINSATLRQELDMSKTRLIEVLNEELQGDFVKEVSLQ